MRNRTAKQVEPPDVVGAALEAVLARDIAATDITSTDRVANGRATTAKDVTAEKDAAIEGGAEGGRAGNDIALHRAEAPPIAPGLDTKEVVERWRVRRHQSAEAMASFGLQALHAQSPDQMLGVWITWSRGVVDRLVADANDNLKLGSLVTQKLATNTTALAKSWSEHTTRG